MFSVDDILSNEFKFNKKMGQNILNWNVDQVSKFLKEKFAIESSAVNNAVISEKIDGKTLLLLNERDLEDLKLKYNILLGDFKKLSLVILKLQNENRHCLVYLGLIDSQSNLLSTLVNPHQGISSNQSHHGYPNILTERNRQIQIQDVERISPTSSVDGGSNSGKYIACIRPEFFKTIVSLGYAFLVTWITAFVMVVVHERVPDSKRYPPLPDIFLDNVPLISWAFFACEVTGSLLFSIWICVLIFHKYRIILLRRFFALGGTVFLLRCFTMLITSLSVPGTHLQCQATDHKFDDGENITVFDMLSNRISRAYTIWSGLGMSIQGVRTCGDYMFSGHTVALTLLNFFITEYTPRNLYFLHTTTWLLNMFGIFFILAAHEHYSIDVFIAFYISSRLFLYYHTLANNQALMSHDSNRTRIWFPLFSYFESSVEGIIPNEYDRLKDIFRTLGNWLVNLKDLCMLTARRIWLTQQDNINKMKLNQPRESAKRQKRSQSHTPRGGGGGGSGSKNVNTNGGSGEKLRKSTGNLISNDTIDRGGSTKKSENHGPTKKEN